MISVMNINEASDARKAGYEFGVTFDIEFVMRGDILEQIALEWGNGKYDWWSGYNTAKDEYLNCN